MLQTKHLYFRLIQFSDVDFLLDLRLNQNLNKYLSQISNEREQQIAWITSYKEKEKLGLDFYFVVEDKKLGDLGFVRVYDIDKFAKTFTWGSWVLKEDRPIYGALESALLLYEFAFNELELDVAKFVVDNENTAVINFHKKFGSTYLHQDPINSHFELKKADFEVLKDQRYSRYFEQK